jgi:hypothetical protein
MVEELEYFNLFKQLNEVFCFFVLMMLWIKKQLYAYTFICLFLTRGVGSSKNFTLKFIIQGLLQLYNRDMSFDLTKTKALLMASIGKFFFSILTI